MAQLAEQPTATAPRVGKQGDPCVMVIFGAAGDLTGRMLIPALYNLARANLLSNRETLHCCHPCGCGGGAFIAVGPIVVI